MFRKRKRRVEILEDVTESLSIWRRLSVYEPRRSVAILAQPILMRAKRPTLVLEREYRFFSSPTAYFIYVDIALALVLRSLWLLRGVAVALALQIGWIVFRWVVYTIDDPLLWASVSFMSTWINRFAKEGEQIITGASSTKMVFAGVAVYNASTGMSYLRAILRYKMSLINQSALNEMQQRKIAAPTTMKNSLSKISSAIGSSSRSSSERLSVRKGEQKMRL